MFALVVVLVALVAVVLWLLGGIGPVLAIVWAWIAGASVVRLKRLMSDGEPAPERRWEDQPFFSGRIEVDDEIFDVRADPEQPGSQNIRWLTGPDPEYGFGYRSSDGNLVSRGELVRQIREFLTNVDRDTGHLE